MKNNNVCGFHDINLIQSKRQPSSLKKLELKQNMEKNVQITFKMKHRFKYDSFNLICLHLWYILGGMYCRDGERKNRDRVCFLSRTFTIRGTAGEGGRYLFFHFHPLHRHLDISRAITAEGSPLHIAGSRTRTGNLWLPSASR